MENRVFERLKGTPRILNFGRFGSVLAELFMVEVCTVDEFQRRWRFHFHHEKLLT
jgi:hypothetical protein